MMPDTTATLDGRWSDRRALLTWAILLCLPLLCFRTLAFLEEQQSAIQVPSRQNVVTASRETKQRAAIERCIALEPFLLPDKGPVSLEKLAQDADEKMLRSWSAKKETEGLVQCVYVWNTKEEARTSPEAWSQAFIEGTSPNMGLRIAKILLLAVFALCLSEILLKFLQYLRLPVVSLTDIPKSFGLDFAPRSGPAGPDAAPKPPNPWIHLVGTTLITGLTSATVVGPEIAKQAVASSQVAERYAETRIRSDQRQERTTITDIKRVLDIQREIDRTRAAGTDEQMMSKLNGIETLATQLRSEFDTLRQSRTADSWTALQAVLGKGIHVNVSGPTDTGTPGSKSPQNVDAALAKLDQMQQDQKKQVDGLKSELAEAQTSLRQEVALRQQDVASSTNAMQAMVLALRQRTCALFVYFDDLEQKRMLFKEEASNRRQLMRDVMGKNEVTADCKDFFPPTTTAKPPPAASPGDGIKTSAHN